ncbi:MAG: hypothetical protein Q9160_006654 [Pyrenula sp. 1 TL-2023]
MSTTSSSIPPAPIGADALLSAAAHRRTHYAITNTSPIPDSRIRSIVETTILNVPSAFNTQSTRILILFKADHERLWDIVAEELRPHVKDDDAWNNHSLPRLQGFRGGYATVIFLEDPPSLTSITQGPYADKAPAWSEQTNAMHQYLVWLALDAEGLGGNLQHYNPLIDEKVKKTWGLPSEWEVKAQLVVGAPKGGMPPGKAKKEVAERVRVGGGAA